MLSLKIIKSSVVCAAVCTGLFGSAFAAEATSGGRLEVLRQGIAHDALFDVCFQGSTGTAVGVAGAALETSDSGATWKEGAISIPASFFGVSCQESSTVAVGQTGAIARKAKGERWIPASSGTDNRLLSVDGNASGLVVAVGGFGAVLRSTDDGLTWSQLRPDWQAILNDDLTEPHIYDVEVTEDGIITLVGEFSLILRSVDNGDTWTVQNKGDSSLFGLDFRNSSVGFAVGQSGMVLKTVDGGITWNDMSSSSVENILSIWSSEDEVLAIGIRTLLRSQDDGLSWQSIEEGDVAVQWYQSIKSAGDGSVVFVGHSGRIVQVKKAM